MTNDTRPRLGHRRGLCAAIYAMAFFSGAAALVYQVVWVDMIAHTLGSTTGSAAVVIAAFMAGLGIGARWFHVLQSRWDNCVFLYGAIEIGIAFTAAGVTLAQMLVPGIYTTLATHINPGWQTHALRFGIAFVGLLAPSALMGATFPALSLVLIRSRSEIDRHLGMIYGINTLGAAAGTLVCGFVLIETLGHINSVWLANAINLSIGIAAFALRRYLPRRGSVQTVSSAETSAPASTTLRPAVLGLVLIVSGFATMAYEIIWIRAAKYLVGNSTYAVSIVLALFLLGLGLGAMAHRLLIRHFRPDRVLVFSQLATGVLALITISLIAYCVIDSSIAHHISMFTDSVRFLPWPSRLLITAIVATVLFLPGTTVMGLTFPLASALYVERMTMLGKRLGSAYLRANLGSIAGVVIGAHVILPEWGTVNGTKIVSAVNIGLAVVLLALLWQWLKQSRAYLLVGAGAVMVLLTLAPSRLPFYGELGSRTDARVRFWEEGAQATVMVVENMSSGDRAMAIDGFLIGVSRSSQHEVGYKQALLAHLPMTLNPGIKRTLNIGLGSGTTLWSLGRYPTIEQLDCVEISAAVVQGAREFEEGSILRDPRTRIFVDDAVHHLLTTRERYGLIISDGKQNPQFPGNSTLLAEDFYRLSLERMTDDGLFVQWIPLNHSPHAFRVILRTFASVFPESGVYYFPPSCAVLVGSCTPISSMEGMQCVRPDLPPWVTHDLSPYFIERTEQLLAGWTTTGDALTTALGPDAPLNTWDLPYLTFIPCKEWRAENNAAYFYENVALLLSGDSQPLNVLQAASEGLRRAFISSLLLREGFAGVIRSLDPERLRPYCEQALDIWPGDTMARGYLSRIDRGLVAVMRPGSRL